MAFHGGPLDGQPVTPQTLDQAGQSGAVDLNALLAGMPGQSGADASGAPSLPSGAPGADAADAAPAGAGDSLSEGARLDRIISDMLAVAGGGDLTEQDKSLVQKAMTIVQQIKANEEKESNDALTGKVSPRLMAQAYGSQGG